MNCTNYRKYMYIMELQFQSRLDTSSAFNTEFEICTMAVCREGSFTRLAGSRPLSFLLTIIQGRRLLRTPQRRLLPPGAASRGEVRGCHLDAARRGRQAARITTSLPQPRIDVPLPSTPLETSSIAVPILHPTIRKVSVLVYFVCLPRPPHPHFKLLLASYFELDNPERQ